MTEQPVEAATEQVWLGNKAEPLPKVPREHYVPNAHLPIMMTPVKTVERRQEPDLWLDAETHADRALNEIQDGNVNAAVAYLQSALAFALNYRHSISSEAATQ